MLFLSFELNVSMDDFAVVQSSLLKSANWRLVYFYLLEMEDRSSGSDEAAEWHADDPRGMLNMNQWRRWSPSLNTARVSCVCSPRSSAQRCRGTVTVFLAAHV